MPGFDTLAFIGRFQPFHGGHKSILDRALSEADKVAVVLGSHEAPRTARNPFTTQERIDMISAVYARETAEGRLRFAPQHDHPYAGDRWVAGVQAGVHAAAFTPFRADAARIGLIGHAKDQSSYYLRNFPQWGSIACENLRGIDGTAIRAALLGEGRVAAEQVPAAVAGLLGDWLADGRLDAVREEHAFVEKYRAQWAASPYPPTFVTVDSVVVQSGHVLLVERRAMPGRGLLALPGGFVGQHETLRDAAIRELREETRLTVPAPVLAGSIAGQRVFDDPWRSQRGRTITTAFLFRLADREELPKVKGGDDARRARWVPFAEIRRERMFEDHHAIIEAMAAI